MMANYYQSYYNSGDNGKPGNVVRAYGREKARSDSEITTKQKEYHKALFDFLKERGVLKDDFFARPRSQKDCSRKIHALHTILCKNGLQDEFYDKEGKDNGEL